MKKRMMAVVGVHSLRAGVASGGSFEEVLKDGLAKVGVRRQDNDS